MTGVKVAPEREYALSGWLLVEKEEMKNPDPFVTVGYDTTGQTTEPIKTISLVWSPNLKTKKTPAAKWFPFQRVFRAKSLWVSLWIRCGNRAAKSPFYIQIDDVELREVARESE